MLSRPAAAPFVFTVITTPLRYAGPRVSALFDEKPDVSDDRSVDTKLTEAASTSTRMPPLR
jgi:hypothetical protein